MATVPALCRHDMPLAPFTLPPRLRLFPGRHRHIPGPWLRTPLPVTVTPPLPSPRPSSHIYPLPRPTSLPSELQFPRPHVIQTAVSVRSCLPSSW